MKLMLLDSASLYFRAFYGVPGTFRAPDGTPVNALRGFLDMIATLVTQYRPSDLVACWDDDWRPAWRVELLASYKTHRMAPDSTAGEQVPDELTVQIPLIVSFLEAAGIARVGAPDCEADDVIGTLATRAAGPVDVVTGDRDLFQLVDDARGVRVIYPGKGGIRDPQLVDQAWLTERYGVATGAQYADLATLRGDTSDGLPGVAGIGEKTAATLLARFGSLQALVAAATAGDPGVTAAQRTRLAAAADYLRVAPTVVNVLRDATLPDVASRLPAAPANADLLDALGRQWGVSSSVDRLTAALANGRQPA